MAYPNRQKHRHRHLKWDPKAKLGSSNAKSEKSPEKSSAKMETGLPVVDLTLDFFLKLWISQKIKT